MSHFDSTTIDQQFEDRFGPIERSLLVWGVRAYPGKGHHARDEALQQARITLWQRFSEDPANWSGKCVKVWVAYAKKTYGHAILHERIVERHSDYAEDMVRKDDSNLTGEEALANKLCSQRRPSRYTREILLADDRIDLVRAIQRGFTMLPERYHADMRMVMADVMEGYNQREIQDKHGWTNNHTRVLFRHLRTTFYEALTGRKRERSAYVGSKTPANEDDLRKLQELRARGLSHVKIAARLGYSPGWVMQNLRRLSTTAALRWANELNGDGSERLWPVLGAVAATWTKPERPQLSELPATAGDTTAAALLRSSGVTGQHA